MSPDRDARYTQEDPDTDFDEEEAPRSIFSATWFRVVLVVLGIGVVGAVAVPYVLDVVNPPPEPKIATAPPAPSAAPAPMTSQSTASAAPSSSSSAPVTATPAPPAAAVETAKPVVSSESTTSRMASASAPAAVADTPKSTPRPKKEPARETAKSDASSRMVAQAAPAEKPAARKPTVAAHATDSGDYFVQVGAYKDQAMATHVAARLRQLNYSVVESTVRVSANGGVVAARPAPPAPAPAAAPAPPPASRTATPSTPDRYDVIVSGGSAADMNARLAAKGLASEPAGEGVRIRPSLPLRDAVALSKDLGSEGFRVQVRRAGGADPAPVAPAPVAATRPVASTPEADGGQILHRVRVGGFPDRTAAQVALRELQEKGYQPFIAKGRE